MLYNDQFKVVIPKGSTIARGICYSAATNRFVATKSTKNDNRLGIVFTAPSPIPVDSNRKPWVPFQNLPLKPWNFSLAPKGGAVYNAIK